MAKTTRKKKPAAEPAPEIVAPLRPPLWGRLRLWILRGIAGVIGLFAALILVFAVVPVPTNLYQMQESWRLGGIERDWVGWDDIAPVMARSVVAAEDANFCLHWGFDMKAIRAALAEGSGRGASTISQQVVKNVFLWQGRNWARKAAEALLTPPVELIWTKRRILHVYLNIAEFGEGVFGVEAAAQHWFGVSARDLTPVQAARLAAILPDPKARNPAKPTASLRRRASQILDGAQTIRADGRAACFEG
ncbi:monofunctional biosynthetic peptidoglycan transglycosylase [Gemmobacter sp. LW-1]|jgi:monofunctional biosynthetic peptidoglycan transglycosylase|uniref:monofunctional biosynthetic peptidoglycan transglycosylase n=1 Tax=Gemmobacter sp. LW-1 TaxID=1529005 RepID=UPI0006C76925|nr:monofunctional biosynthetic peptidoglycan transglycosylase [Gemmobacter sp. LW-1]OJY36278.1 MAG: monofunctional biosynthetic peptidoglycan transglycosylase [Rhodobacterales bacterium 65-51]